MHKRQDVNQNNNNINNIILYTKGKKLHQYSQINNNIIFYKYMTLMLYTQKFLRNLQ